MAGHGKAFCIAIIAALALLAGNAPGTAADAREINASVNATLDRFYRQIPGSRELSARATGVLVFPTIIKAGFGVGGEYGEGAIPAQHPAALEAWGDVVLRGRDLAASYHLAVVVDDALQGVTDVVRGRDLLAATAVHRLLQALLGLAEPRYRHHRLVLDQTGEKLSRSRQSWSLAELRATGLAPEGVRAALGFASGASVGPAVEFG